MQIPSPGVGGVEAPVSSEGHGGDDKFPTDTGGIAVGEEGEQRGELEATKHRFLRGGGGKRRRRAVTASVEEEEGCWALGKCKI